VSELDADGTVEQGPFREYAIRASMARLPSESDDPETVRGESFEEQVRADREATATFLHELADQLEAGTDLTMAGDDWEIPFTYEEPIEIEYEVEPAGDGSLEAELEIEFTGFQEDGDENELHIR
jgi:amphi-Trp domain-containing protein